MRIYTVRTKERQGEYLKPEYDKNTNPKFWNHFSFSTRKKAIQRAENEGLKNYWIDFANI